MSILKPLAVWITATLENPERVRNARTLYLSPEKPVCGSKSNSSIKALSILIIKKKKKKKKQQLEPDKEQQTGSRFGKEFVKVVYYHLAY